MVHPGRSNLVEVVLCDPRVPVVRKTVVGFASAKRLAEGVLVLDDLALRPRLKERRRDPWLEDKPASKVDTADLVAVVVKLQVIVSLSMRAVRLLLVSRWYHSNRGEDVQCAGWRSLSKGCEEGKSRDSCGTEAGEHGCGYRRCRLL